MNTRPCAFDRLNSLRQLETSFDRESAVACGDGGGRPDID
jgi:hypothetical protein